MATFINYKELDAITEKYYLPVMQDQIFSKDAVFAKMKENKEVVSGGTKIAFAVKHDNLVHGTAGRDELFDISEKSIFNAAEVEIKRLYANLTSNGFEETLNAGDQAVFSLLKEKMKDLEEAMRQELLSNLYGEQKPNGFDSLETMVNNTGTYAGINRLSDGNDFWKSQVIEDGVSGIDLDTDPDIAYKSLREYYMKVSDGGQDQNNLVFVGDFGTINKIEFLLSRRNQITTVKEKDANLGFQHFTLFGRPVHASSYLEKLAEKKGKGILYAINLDYVKMKTMKNSDFRMTDFKAAQNNDVRVKQLIVMGNFINQKPARSGVMRDIKL